MECAFDTESTRQRHRHHPSYLLVPTVITADNLQDLVDTGLYTMGRRLSVSATNE